MRVLFGEEELRPFPHGKPGDKYVLRFEPGTDFECGGRLYRRGAPTDVVGVVAQASGGPGVTVQVLKLRPFELSTTTDSSAPNRAAWRAQLMDAQGELVERVRALNGLRLSPEVGRPETAGGETVRRATLVEAFTDSLRVRAGGAAQAQTPADGAAPSAPIVIQLDADADGAAPRDPSQPTPVVDTTPRAGEGG